MTKGGSADVWAVDIAGSSSNGERGVSSAIALDLHTRVPSHGFPVGPSLPPRYPYGSQRLPPSDSIEFTPLCPSHRFPTPTHVLSLAPRLSSHTRPHFPFPRLSSGYLTRVWTPGDIPTRTLGLTDSLSTRSARCGRRAHSPSGGQLPRSQNQAHGVCSPPDRLLSEVSYLVAISRLHRWQCSSHRIETSLSTFNCSGNRLVVSLSSNS